MDSLSKLCFATTEGVSMLGINETAKTLGLDTVCAKTSVVELSETPLPPDFDYASPILDFSIFRGQNRHFCPRLVSFEHQTRA